MVELSHGITLPAATRVLRYRTEQAWLEARRGGCGASQAAKILGLSPYGGPWDVWASKRGVARKRKRLHRYAVGHREESRILEDYAADTGHGYIGPLGFLQVHGPEPLQVTPDAFLQVKGEWGGGELKLSDPRAAFRWGRSGQVIDGWTSAAAKEIREDYAVQVYCLLAATGLPWWKIIVKQGLYETSVYTIVADPRTQSAILGRVRRWWSRHITEGQPPALDASDACRQTLPKIWGTPEEKTYRIATARERELATAIATARQYRKDFDVRLRNMEAELSALIASSGVYGIEWQEGRQRKRVPYYPRQGSRQLDAEALRRDHPELADQYTTTTEATRVLRVS